MAETKKAVEKPKATIKTVTTEAKAAPAAPAKVEAPKAEVKKETKAASAKKATAKKSATAKKPAAKKTAPAKKAETKAASTKKPAAKKAPAKKAAELDVNVELQFGAFKHYTQDELVKIAKDVYQYDMNGNVEDIKTLNLYVKPEENRVYFVINEDVNGDFAI